jgi:hypothetical protein
MLDVRIHVRGRREPQIELQFVGRVSYLRPLSSCPTMGEIESGPGELLEATRHVHVPGFGAVIFRRTTAQIRNEGGLWDESLEIFPLLGGVPKEHDLYWQFPAGTAVSLSHLEHDKTVLNWQRSQIPLVCFDELTPLGQSWLVSW